MPPTPAQQKWYEYLRKCGEEYRKHQQQKVVPVHKHRRKQLRPNRSIGN